MRTDKPWGYEELLFSGSHYSLKRLFMRGGESCSLQYHQLKHETVLVFDGLLLLEYGPAANSLEKIELGPGDFFALEPGVVHRMSATNDCLYYEASTSELDDVIRLSDLYGRA